MSRTPRDIAKMVLKGDRKAIARSISIVENREEGYSQILSEVYPSTGRALMIGVTGPPGTGKSTLVDGLVNRFGSKYGLKVSVLALDPTSPISGGAILGDRVRMLAHALDEKVYIRSMASRGDEGGLSKAAMNATRILDASGSDVIIVETVGIGQSEIEIVKVADVVLVVLMPELGDEIQAAKAGLMEVGDVYIVNKCDLPGADKVLFNIQTVISKSQKALKVSSKTGEGVENLASILKERGEELKRSANFEEKRRTALSEEIRNNSLDSITASLSDALEKDPEFQQLLQQVVERRKDPESASKMLAERYLRSLGQ